MWTTTTMDESGTPLPPFASNLPKALAPPHRRTFSLASRETSRKSSFQEIWAEDYYPQQHDDSAGDNPLANILLPPPPATLTSRADPAQIAEDPCKSQQTQGHKRSLTALLPFRSRANSRVTEKSPVQETDEPNFTPTLTGDTDAEVKIADKKSGLSGWFSGSSAPVVFGIPISEQDTVPSTLAKMSTPTRESSPDRVPAKLQKRPTMASPTSSSRFSLFTSKSSKSESVRVSAGLDDEFLSLDLDAALFPSGREPCSPAAYNRILENAESLFLRMQTAYKLRTVALSEALEEKTAQEEELDEAETRAEHLKLQLEDMASKAAEKDAMIEALKSELEQERNLRKERERSIVMVKAEDEDLGISNAPSRGDWRKSRASMDTDVDAETETESLRAESIFSSPAVSSRSCASPTPTFDSTHEICQASYGKVVGVPVPKGVGLDKPKPTSQPSAFQRILKGISSGAAETEAEGCSNCRGQNASVAWDTVGLLKAENRSLKEQVQELEAAVEGALDVCMGVGA